MKKTDENGRQFISNLQNKRIVKVETVSGRSKDQYYRLWFNKKDFVDIDKYSIFDREGAYFSDNH